MAGEQVETWEKFFTELPVLVDQRTRHLHSSNLSHLEHLFICLDDSRNVLNSIQPVGEGGGGGKFTPPPSMFFVNISRFLIL